MMDSAASRKIAPLGNPLPREFATVGSSRKGNSPQLT